MIGVGRACLQTLQEIGVRVIQLMKRRDDGNRADLTDEQWTKIKLCCCRHKHGNQPMTIAELSMASSGSTELVPHGETSQNIWESSDYLQSVLPLEKAGIWQQIWASLMQQADATGESTLRPSSSFRCNELPQGMLESADSSYKLVTAKSCIG